MPWWKINIRLNLNSHVYWHGGWISRLTNNRRSSRQKIINGLNIIELCNRNAYYNILFQYYNGRSRIMSLRSWIRCCLQCGLHVSIWNHILIISIKTICNNSTVLWGWSFDECFVVLRCRKLVSYFSTLLLPACSFIINCPDSNRQRYSNMLSPEKITIISF